MNAIQCVEVLAQRQEIKRFSFVRYQPVPSGASRARSLTGAERIRSLTETSADKVHHVQASRIRRYERLERVICPSVWPETVGIGSAIVTRINEERHLMLLDFSATADKATDRELLDIFSLLRWRGWLLHSGASYHWLGADHYSRDQWSELMGQALLFPVQVDVRYVGHCLHRGSAALRLFACEGKPHEPTVVGAVGVDIV